MADGEPRNVLGNAISIFEALHHDKWIDAQGHQHDIEKMDPVHRLNCIEFLIDRAAGLEIGYAIGEFFYWGTVFDPLWEYNDDADVLDEMLLNAQFERSKDPEAWLETVPIMQRLRAAHDKFESDHNFAASSL